MKNTFSTGAVLKEAYGIMKPKFWTIIGQYVLIGFLLPLLFSALLGKGAIIGSMITVYISVKWSLAYVKKGSFSFDDLFENITLKKFIYYILAMCLVGLSILGGFILFIIPAIIFAVRLALVKFIAIEKDLKPMAALKESKRITKGNRWKLFGFFVIMTLINILGFICLVVGVLFTAPLTALTLAVIYKKLSEQGPDAVVVTPALEQ